MEIPNRLEGAKAPDNSPRLVRTGAFNRGVDEPQWPRPPRICLKMKHAPICIYLLVPFSMMIMDMMISHWIWGSPIFRQPRRRKPKIVKSCELSSHPFVSFLQSRPHHMTLTLPGITPVTTLRILSGWGLGHLRHSSSICFNMFQRFFWLSLQDSSHTVPQDP